jgi:DNA excision repair protein ERCC-3
MGVIGTGHEDLLNGEDLAAAAEEKETHSFEIDPAQVLCFFQMCIPVEKILHAEDLFLICDFI